VNAWLKDVMDFFMVRNNLAITSDFISTRRVLAPSHQKISEKFPGAFKTLSQTCLDASECVGYLAAKVNGVF